MLMAKPSPKRNPMNVSSAPIPITSSPMSRPRGHFGPVGTEGEGGYDEGPTGAYCIGPGGGYVGAGDDGGGGGALGSLGPPGYDMCRGLGIGHRKTCRNNQSALRGDVPRPDRRGRARSAPAETVAPLGWSRREGSSGPKEFLGLAAGA